MLVQDSLALDGVSCVACHQQSLDSSGMISFKDDYMPSTVKIKKTAYRALMVEKQLRREIIKLKKQISTS